MAIVTRSGLVQLVKDVQTYFTDNGVTARVAFGWKERTKQINQGPGRANRVIFIPSDPNGRGGRISAAHQPGPRAVRNSLGTVEGRIRALRSWDRIGTACVWAVDSEDAFKLQDEAAQVEATEALFEEVIRAVHQSAHVSVQWDDVDWTVSPVEHLFGRELLAKFTFKHPFFDRPSETAFPDFAITPTLNPEAG